MTLAVWCSEVRIWNYTEEEWVRKGNLESEYDLCYSWENLLEASAKSLLAHRQYNLPRFSWWMSPESILTHHRSAREGTQHPRSMNENAALRHCSRVCQVGPCNVSQATERTPVHGTAARGKERSRLNSSLPISDVCLYVSHCVLLPV